MENSIVQVQKRRTLKKVRTSFINRTAGDNQQDRVVNVPALLNPNTFNIIDPMFGLVEKNRKVYFGIHYIQSHFNLLGISIEDAPFTKTVTINIQPKKLDGLPSWELGVDRLESYGDLALATLGWKLRNYKATYPLIMKKYFEMMSSADSTAIANIRKARNRAILFARDLESKHLYKKVHAFFGKGATGLSSISYSKELVEQIGYKMDDFVDRIKGNGLPCIFKGDSSFTLDIMMSKLESFFSEKDFVFERPEFVISICDKEGVKKEAVAQSIRILEPVQEGIFVTSYIIIKKVQDASEKKVSCEVLGETNLKMIKPSVNEKENTLMETIN